MADLSKIGDECYRIHDGYPCDPQTDAGKAFGRLKYAQDVDAVFALVARECGAPEQPETLLEAVERLAAFKRGEASCG